MIFNTIKKFDEEIKNTKNHLDLIIYYTKLNERAIYACENELIKYLINKEKNIIFVLNSFGLEKKKNKTKKLYDTYIASLKQIIEENKKSTSIFEKKKIIEEKKILDNIELVNQIQSIDEDDDDGSRKIKQCYGMDELFKKIYDIFQSKKISINEIKPKNIDELLDNIGKYDLLSNIRKIIDIQLNLKINISNTILSWSQYDYFVLFGKEDRRKKLLKIMAEELQDNVTDFDKLYSELENKIKTKKIKDIVKDFFDSMKKIKGEKTTNFNYNATFYNEHTIAIASTYLEKLQKIDQDLGLLDEKTKNFIIEFSNALNKAIDGFNSLSDEWKKNYEDIKSYKTEHEWIKKFFILEKIE